MGKKKKKKNPAMPMSYGGKPRGEEEGVWEALVAAVWAL